MILLFGKKTSFEDIDAYVDYINKIYLAKDLISLLEIDFSLIRDLDLFFKVYQYYLFNSMYERDSSLLVFNFEGKKLYWLYESSVVIRGWVKAGVDRKYVCDSFVLYWSWIVRPEFYNS